MDEHCQLRIFATCDEVLAAVAAALGVAVAPALPAPPTGDVFELRYDATTGARLPVGSPTTTLDLRAGQKVRIVNQPDWDAERCGTVATVIGRDAHGHWIVELPFGGAGRKRRTLGAWWVAAALEGSVPSLPLVNAADATGTA